MAIDGTPDRFPSSTAGGRLARGLPDPLAWYARDWAHVPIVLSGFDGNPYQHGATRFERGRPVAIVLHEKLTSVQRRAALAHELHHCAYGLDEALIRRLTALWLIPEGLWREAATTGATTAQLAAAFAVTHSVVEDRRAAGWTADAAG